MYQYDPEHTAIHLACRVEDFDPDSHSIWRRMPFGSKTEPVVGAIGALPGPGPLSAWEPYFPNRGACERGILEKVKEACKRFDVIVLSFSDLEKLFPHDKLAQTGTPQSSVRASVKSCAEDLIQSSVGPQRLGTVVIRVGLEGCLVATRRFHRGRRSMTDAEKVQNNNPTVQTDEIATVEGEQTDSKIETGRSGCYLYVADSPLA